MSNFSEETSGASPQVTVLRHPRDYNNLLRLLLVIWLGLGLIVLALWALAQIADILIVFILGLLIAVSFAPFVRWLRSVLHPKVPDVAVVIMVYAVGLSIVVGAIGALAFPLIDQAQQLTKQVPIILEDASKALPSVEKSLHGIGIDVNIGQLSSRFSAQIQAGSKAVLSGLASGVAAATSAVAQGLLAVVLSIYMLLGAQRFRARLAQVVPTSIRSDVESLVSRLSEIASSFIRGQVILALSIGIPVGIFAYLIGLPYSILLGLISALAEFIPVVGSILGAGPAIIVALVVGGPKLALIVIVFFIILNQVEGNIIYPRVVGGELGIHPIVSIFALAVGFKYFGIWGAVLGVPAAAVIWALAVQARRAWPTMMQHLEHPEPLAAAGTPAATEAPPEPGADSASAASTDGDEQEETEVDVMVDAGVDAEAESEKDPEQKR